MKLVGRGDGRDAGDAEHDVWSYWHSYIIVYNQKNEQWKVRVRVYSYDDIVVL